jgi:hypothetical protein
MSKRHTPLSGQQAKLNQLAKQEMDRWFSSLSPRDRGKLKIHHTRWGRSGGRIIALGVRHGKTARRKKKLKGEREAAFRPTGVVAVAASL